MAIVGGKGSLTVMPKRLRSCFLGPREKTTTSEDSILLVACHMKKG